MQNQQPLVRPEQKIEWASQCGRFQEDRGTVFRHVRIIAKSDYRLRHVCLSDRQVTSNNSGPTERIVMKINIRLFF